MLSFDDFLLYFLGAQIIYNLLIMICVWIYKILAD